MRDRRQTPLQIGTAICMCLCLRSFNDTSSFIILAACFFSFLHPLSAFHSATRLQQLSSRRNLKELARFSPKTDSVSLLL